MLKNVKKLSMDKDYDYIAEQAKLQAGTSYSQVSDIGVDFISELGRTTISIKELLALEIGSVIDLQKPAGESVELYINNCIFGKGEVMVYEKNLAIRINEILNSQSVVAYFKKEIE